MWRRVGRRATFVILVVVVVATMVVTASFHHRHHSSTVVKRQAFLSYHSHHRDGFSNRTVSTSARFLLTPLDGASLLWQVAPPWHPLGCLFAHTHVVVPTAERDVFVTFEYHPQWPPLLKYFWGTGEVRRTISVGWLPVHRQQRHIQWLELPIAHPNMTFDDIERFNDGWCCPYDMVSHTCQHYTIALMQFLTGSRLDQCFLYDRVSLGFLIPVFCYVNVVLMSVPLMELLTVILVLTSSNRRQQRSLSLSLASLAAHFRRRSTRTHMRQEAWLVVSALLCVAVFVLVCSWEYHRQTWQCLHQPTLEPSPYCVSNLSLYHEEEAR